MNNTAGNSSRVSKTTNYFFDNILIKFDVKFIKKEIKEIQLV